jgi:hypothetical protein
LAVSLPKERLDLRLEAHVVVVRGRIHIAQFSHGSIDRLVLPAVLRSGLRGRWSARNGRQPTGRRKV